MTTVVAEAIENSITQNRIVTIGDPAPADIESLEMEADDSVENGPVIEFWGTDDDGDDWRVHVEKA